MSESFVDQVAWNADGLVPAIAQDAATGEVLMLAWMSRESLAQTVASGEAVYWSRSRRSLWRKGETSGHFQKIVEIRLDCDADAILLRVEQAGGIACHTGRRHCFFKRLDRTVGAPAWRVEEPMSASAGMLPVAAGSRVLDRLEAAIASRRGADPGSSWVAKLNAKGLDAILKKIGEEATETVIAGKAGSREEVVHEVADLWFHCLVLLERQGIPLPAVWEELERREGRSGVAEKASRKE